ncbi:hypothetical protein H0H92_006000 [Tricholoma furcatifolium]|nr:hypothetical protein H0H92_006000 [Tricholoma furcatifolium]
MPLPTSRDAPKFNGKEPKTILRFLDQMESLFESAGLTNDEEEMKYKIIAYTDPETEREWRGFDSFYDGTWEEFIEEIKESYPEAAAEEGSVSALDKICREFSDLTQRDTSDVHKLIRSFRAEAKKLQGIVGNGVLVDKFLRYGHYKDRSRHKDNKYELAEVIHEVKTLLDDSVRVKVKDNKKSVLYEHKSEEDVPDESMAQLKDSVAVLGKEFASLRASLQSIESGIKTCQHNTCQHSNTAGGSHAHNNFSKAKNPSGPSFENCFYCWLLGHRVPECPHLKKHVEEGMLILVDGRSRLTNGAIVPNRPPNISPRDRVNKLRETSVAAFYGWNEEESDYLTPTMSIYTNAARDARDDMLERIGQDKAEKEASWGKEIASLKSAVETLVQTRSGGGKDVTPPQGF